MNMRTTIKSIFSVIALSTIMLTQAHASAQESKLMRQVEILGAANNPVLISMQGEVIVLKNYFKIRQAKNNAASAVAKIQGASRDTNYNEIPAN